MLRPLGFLSVRLILLCPLIPKKDSIVPGRDEEAGLSPAGPTGGRRGSSAACSEGQVGGSCSSPQAQNPSPSLSNSHLTGAKDKTLKKLVQFPLYLTKLWGFACSILTCILFSSAPPSVCLPWKDGPRLRIYLFCCWLTHWHIPTCWNSELVTVLLALCLVGR